MHLFIHESATTTISIHRTRKGAESAMEFHRENERKIHFQMYEDDKLNAPEFGKHEYWGVKEIEIQE